MDSPLPSAALRLKTQGPPSHGAPSAAVARASQADPAMSADPDTIANSTDVDAACSTLYPKTSGKLADLTHNITAFLHPDRLPENLPPTPMAALLSSGPTRAASFEFTGTVKLHGTHADIVVHVDGEIVCQSRNRLRLSVASDNLGFALFCSTRSPAIHRLAGTVRQRWRDRHPGAEPGKDGEDGTVLLAGEWIGQGVQKGVAIAELPKCFVLCGVHVAGAWQPIELHLDLEDAAAGMLNVSRGGFFHLAYSSADAGEAFLAEAKGLTLAVAAACPFGAAMGVSGAGEGIVWTPSAGGELPNRPEFWLKTKGEHFHQRAGQRARTANALNAASVKERGKLFAEECCSEGRLEQGWAYLLEMGVERSMRGIGVFLKWVTTDIEVEEKREIEAGGVGLAWKGEVIRIAKAWYEKMMEEKEKPPAA
ncbi:hypothetical protein LTR53_000631 [Teratosphaeriaceae sp. CCFEE 6253]|nr:hypothetical protein LTR53_000631 [Teratosphaeriaceae sp. CCFEE 6253]